MGWSPGGVSVGAGMVFLSPQSDASRSSAVLSRPYMPNLFDALAFCLLAGLVVVIAHGGEQFDRPLSVLQTSPVQLDLARLPGYAALTTLRMFAALLASLLFTFIVAPLAAKSRKAELIIVPALDILQSVPVLGFLTFTVTFFMGLFPNRELGLECASIFAIFTAQATAPKSRLSMAMDSQEPMPGRANVRHQVPNFRW